MQWLIRFVGQLGRLLGWIRRMAVQAILLLVYFIGVGPAALCIRLRALAGGEKPGLQPAEPVDTGAAGLEKMV